VKAPAGPQRDTALHEARKAAKRARYAGEGAEAVLGRPARRFARRMRSAQELLGARQDALLACGALPRLAAEAHAAGEPGFGYGVLYAAQRAAVERCDAGLPEIRAAVRSSTRYAELSR
jgi:CHAD domain-containing protein